MSSFAKIDLIHIGFHKCASTTLQNDLFLHHPRIAFTRNSKCALDPTFEWTNARWRGLSKEARDYFVISSEGLCGVDFETFNGSSARFEFAEKMHALHADAKIFMIVRRQADIIRSYYNESIIKTHNTRPFSYFLAKSFENGFFEYDVLVEEYARLFGKERVLVLPMEALARHPEMFLERLSEFSGVEFRSRNVGRRNRSGGRLSNEIVRLCNLPLKRIGMMNRLHSPKRRVRGFIDMVIPKALELEYFGQATLDRLRSHFRDSNERLSKLMGLDLERDYGY